MTEPMQWVSALSTQPSLEAAVKEVVEQAQSKLDGAADLGFVFISSAFLSDYPRLMPLLRSHLPEPVLLGCSGGGVVGDRPIGSPQEIEGSAALSLTLAKLPEVSISPFLIESVDQLPDMDGPPDPWMELVGVSPDQNPQFIVLADPMTEGISDFLQGLDFAYPGSVKVGGLASVSVAGGQSGMFLDDQNYENGILGVALTGNIVLDAIVAQGCRPIGDVYRVVTGERNIILTVESDEPSGDSTLQTTLAALQGVIQSLDGDDLKLAQNSLFVGVAQSEFKQELEHGDFLIRNLLGVDPRVGALAVGDRVRPGQRIQFHLRDATTSADDLNSLFQRYTSQSHASPVGALMFSCMGRGEYLYKQANFDSGVLSRYFQHLPVGGFFCNGEIGPVGGTTFIHGYTSVFGIVRQP
ncbi:MAG: FIST N-terminal domain-containing protein [Elainellaceae cyanobacterium]